LLRIFDSAGCGCGVLQDSFDFSVDLVRRLYGDFDSSAMGFGIRRVRLIREKNGRGKSHEGFGIGCHFRHLWFMNLLRFRHSQCKELERQDVSRG